MGIFGWDLPPGCRVSDIPGNRPEDERWEAIIENFFNIKRIRNRKYGIPIYEKEIRAMSAIYRAKKYQKIQEAVDSYICMAIEYGIDIGNEEAEERINENKYYKQWANEEYRNPKLRAFFKAQRKKIKDLEELIQNYQSGFWNQKEIIE